MKKPKVILGLIKSLLENNGHLTSRELPRSKKVSTNQLYKAILTLSKLGLIQICGELSNNRFELHLVRDPQFLNLEQKVKAIFYEDKSKTKSFKFHTVALKNSIASIEDSSYWSVDDKVKTKLKVYKPKREFGKIVVEKIELGVQKAYTKLTLNPPTRAREKIIHGFKVIQSNYFTFTQKETIERYGDPEMMDGLSVMQPTLLATLEIRFPESYRFIDVKAEKYDLVIIDGPQIPSPIRDHRLIIERNRIILKLVYPSFGYYFISWKAAQ
ncbi:hypothetical protein [Sulfolobus sp. E11-6]|uniref:hypothetical protein n=1 Tax=Sulfolobus sp. E11-6 TaxID=2663020 RepID=UPI0012949ED4|nr:hypothetical protein [Sulfolobus sp. E11-6]QGA68645.1 hypothetical protein GFS33_07870 [Sulfolobus sp. E11-6]